MKQEAIIEARKWGNSSGLLLPREWIGKQVKVILIDRSEEIREEVLEILDDYMEDLMGIYLCGSWARGEQSDESDIDIIAISEGISRKISSGKYNIEIYPIEKVRKTIKENPIMIVPRLMEAKVILNKGLLNELRNGIINKGSYKEYTEDCRRIIKINKGLLNLSKENADNGVIYSLVLRLRGIYLLNIMKNKKEYSKEGFIKWLGNSSLNYNEIEDAYECYKSIRDNKRFKQKIPVEIGRKLIDFFEKEVKKWQTGKRG